MFRSSLNSLVCKLSTRSGVQQCLSQSRRAFAAAVVPERLEGKKKEQALLSIPSWTPLTEKDAITKTFMFDDFVQAFYFMTRVGVYAEQQQHHPEWFNVYNKVEITLNTHDCNGLSEKDIAMAKKIDREALKADKYYEIEGV